MPAFHVCVAGDVGHNTEAASGSHLRYHGADPGEEGSAPACRESGCKYRLSGKDARGWELVMHAKGDSPKGSVDIGPVVLVHKPLWACGRVSGIAMFQFGRRLTLPGGRGGTREVGEYGLHVQCGWRITQENKVLVGSRDLYCPASFDEQAHEIPADFDWDSALTRR